MNINIKLTVEKHKLFNREKINNLRNFELHYPTKTAKLANLTLKRETQKLHLGGRSNMDNTKQVFKKCISIHLEGRFYSKEIYCEGLRVVFEATHKQLQSNLKISGASKNT